jgi:hypothetical protein
MPLVTEQDKGRCAPAPGSTLGDVLPKEIERCQELLTEYAALGPAGAWGHVAISRDIAAAHKAMMEGDVVAMLRAYEHLRGCK